MINKWQIINNNKNNNDYWIYNNNDNKQLATLSMANRQDHKGTAIDSISEQINTRSPIIASAA